MNIRFRKITAAAAAALMLIGTAGCKDENEQSDFADVYENVAQEDMPYGASIAQLKPELNENLKLGIEYDNRYLTEDEAVKISDYVYALDKLDAELMNQTVYPGYLDQYAERAGASDLKGYLEMCRENIEDNYIYDEFEFTYISVNDCITEENDTDGEANFSSVDANLSSTYGDLNITDRKMIKIDIMYSVASDNGSYSFSMRQGSDSIIYVYTIDGEPYIIL